MRYAQGGGLTAERRAFREQLRREAAERFVRGDATTVVARHLRVTVRSVQRWRKSVGRRRSTSTGVEGPCLAAAAERRTMRGAGAGVGQGTGRAWLAGPDLDSVADQDPDRAPVHKSYTVQGVAALLKRHGWTCQVPARRALERDEEAVAGWVKETWPRVE